ncbi:MULTISPECIES: alpha/beta-type small acid-soluble spore protein [Paenibacillus]|uniref:Small acid-soluble spore protein n=3 Tax=Paenibacillus mucilaginosus TaxID=61624 RepID=H6NT60_9BACL|nr:MULTISPECIES: alpha/beta-type small acid-soluble spore protein [Paenibacillus]AEI38740.1 small acid-soluble spore protein [Paenibacillus mucilaginosus KNP414]AFC27073.1 small acid-soluble spore protein [Paenibacillus mucilaginosus 3016]AFH59209.1 spore protein [Paenibacillus mucilaginosus K02]MCG7215875.1 alpha/beta-type small acid-soluble spore protein [Paenibacillus mucilaginosus]MCZ8523324.1 alpha/beta-type small acid-soluble spore protein [Paenibacillus caseinilyticus]
MSKTNKKVVPESGKALDVLKYEIAAELGLPVGKSAANLNVEFATELGAIPSQNMKEDYWGHIASRDAGAVGGTITSRLIRKAEEMMFNL